MVEIQKVIVVSVVLLLLFGLPVVYFLIKNKAFTPFSFVQITKSFNRALLIQVPIAIVLMIAGWTLDERIYGNGSGNDFTDIFMYTVMWFPIIGLFYYIPGLLILNLISFIGNRLKKK